MLPVGTVLNDRYVVRRLLAQGRMGAVYLAKDRGSDRVVTLKEITLDDNLTRESFERQARLLTNLSHSALPKVIDHFASGNQQVLVMEYLSGDDLTQILSKRGDELPLNKVLEWADQLLSALEYLHNRQIIHRDIKPENLALNAQGRVVLLDFGTVKPSGTENPASFFTPSYAAPEQAQGAPTTGSDLYSVGATLYHLLTGKEPVDSLSRLEALADAQPDPLLPPHEVSSEVPYKVSEVLMKAMSLRREERPADAASMREALRHARLPDALINRKQEINNRSFHGSEQACSVCGRIGVPLEARLEARHIVPVEQEGRNTYDNLQFVCRSCHALLDKVGVAPEKAGEMASTAYQLELTAADILHDAGFAVLSGATGPDAGVDVIARYSDSGTGQRRMLLVQCKAGRESLRAEEITEFAAKLSQYAANLGVIVSNKAVSSAAMAAARNFGISIVSIERFPTYVRWLKGEDSNE